jgi:hypothetical protein
MFLALRGHATFKGYRTSLCSQIAQPLFLAFGKRIQVTAVPMAATRDYANPTATTTCLAFDLTAGEDGPRLGTMSMRGRSTVQTPHYFALSSRGAVPHISQDMMHDHTAIMSIYCALEDCEPLSWISMPL